MEIITPSLKRIVHSSHASRDALLPLLYTGRSLMVVVSNPGNKTLNLTQISPQKWTDMGRSETPTSEPGQAEWSLQQTSELHSDVNCGGGESSYPWSSRTR